MIISAVWQDRQHAGYLLSKQLALFKHTNAIVVGIPHGGVCVASAIADRLSLPLEVMPCRTIEDPRDGSKNIGSVSQDDVFLHDCAHTIPQDYISHQILMLRDAISQQNKNYYGDRQRASLRGRAVIVVDDLLASSDTMMACLRGIKKQEPLKIVVAVPVISTEAARIVGAEADDVQFVRMEACVASPHEYFADFRKIDDQKVKEILDASIKSVKDISVTQRH